MTRWTNFSSLISCSPHPSVLLSKDYGYPRLQKHQSSLAEERDATLQQGSNLKEKKNRALSGGQGKELFLMMGTASGSQKGR